MHISKCRKPVLNFICVCVCVCPCPCVHVCKSVMLVRKVEETSVHYIDPGTNSGEQH
jgi:hypothetical protein